MPAPSQPAPAASAEPLSRLRPRLRVPVSQIISCAELMREDACGVSNDELAACLSGTIAACESLLDAASICGARPENGEPLYPSREHIAEGWERIANFSAQLEQLVLANGLRIVADDAAELQKAAGALKEVIDEFTPSLPPAADLLQTRSASEAQPGRHSSSGRTAEPLGDNRNATRGELILVVDDNEGNRDLLSRRLIRHGYKVMSAETGSHALLLTAQHDFDLVLLDIMMPEMDGFTVLAELKKNGRLRHIPVIMISAMDEIESVVRCIELGADDYLTKPFNPVVLRARISALLERKHLRDEELCRARELEEASAEIDRQRKKSDSLLQNILPQSVAHELQLHGSVQPMYFEDVTIVFADFVNFTIATEQLAADDLVNILHEYFTVFDRITNRYGLEKLKTIGDCYMFVGGLPFRNPSHPVDVILAAFEMTHATRELAATGPVDWQLRIGVHTGPVVAGVVGIHKFAFDIWGEAVNMAQRMEANAAPRRVNISLNTYSRVKDFFRCERRGKVVTKEGREVEMYFVNGIAGRSQAEGIAARVESFQQRYQTYFRKGPQAFPDFLRVEEGI